MQLIKDDGKKLNTYHLIEWCLRLQKTNYKDTQIKNLIIINQNEV